MNKIIFATQNKGKAEEVKKIFEGTGIEILSLNDLEEIPEIIESGQTFEENAKIKAKEIFDRFQTPAVGDDSGLAVEQLNGAPGVYSARYSGENKNDKKNNEKLNKRIREIS